MSLYSDYLAAAIPPPFTVLGVTLRPFSLGHKMVLGRINSPFEIGGLPKISDIVLAVLICSNDYAGAVELLDRPDLERVCTDWAIALQFRGRWPFRKIVPVEWGAKIKLFNQYLEHHSRQPVISFDGNKYSNTAENCPTPQLVKVELMSKLGLTETETLNRCWSLCMWDYYTLRVMAGAANFVDKDAEAELLAKARGQS